MHNVCSLNNIKRVSGCARNLQVYAICTPAMSEYANPSKCIDYRRIMFNWFAAVYSWFQYKKKKNYSHNNTNNNNRHKNLTQRKRNVPILAHGRIFVAIHTRARFRQCRRLITTHAPYNRSFIQYKIILSVKWHIVTIWAKKRQSATKLATTQQNNIFYSHCPKCGKKQEAKTECEKQNK